MMSTTSANIAEDPSLAAVKGLTELSEIREAFQRAQEEEVLIRKRFE